MKKDSTVVNLGGIIIKEVTETRGGDSTGQTIRKIENIERGPVNLIRPVVTMYFISCILVLLLLAFSFWYYIKSKKEIARLMVQNGMQPGDLFKLGGSQSEGIGKPLRFAIFFIGLGIAFLINFFLRMFGLHSLQIVVLFLTIGVCLLIVNKLKK